MSRFVFISATVVFFILCVRPSFEKAGSPICSNAYFDSPKCRYRNEICCYGTCNSTCVGKRCRWNAECSSYSRGHKCCAGYCRANCEGSACASQHDCKDRSLKCCNKVCRKGSCLGAACNRWLQPYRACGWHEGKRLDCCGGRCELSCKNKPCFENSDCGGWSRKRMKCCNGVCQRSCLGSPCFEHNDCQSRKLDCCGFFENKTCARSCINHGCSLADFDECGRRRNLFCCGDQTCRPNCIGFLCYSETVRYDCRAPGRILFCCGMGEKKCRIGCSHVRCEKNEDCGISKYYCGHPDSRNVSTCTFTRVTDQITVHDVRLDDLEGYN